MSVPRSEELRSDPLLEAVFADSPVGFALLDPALRIRTINPALAQRLGVRIDACRDRALPELLPVIDERYGAALRHVVATGERVSNLRGRTPPTGPDDREREWLIHAFPVRAGAEVVGVAVTCAEITVLVDAKRELDHAEARVRDLLAREQAARAEAEQASRAKDEFLAMLGHELRNPLAPILTAVQLVRLRGAQGCEREMAIIERHADHMVRLVDDLLDVSRITRGMIQLKLGRVDIADVIARAVEMTSPLLENRQHRLELVVSRGRIVRGDQARLVQVVTNLLVNAARYTEPGGHIRIAVREDDHDVVLEVQDDGIGIDAALLPRVFELFTQGTASRGGLGLGLSLVKSLVELHGGTVAAHSEGAGRGATFTVRLPRAEARRATGPDARAAAAPARRLSILLVDDNQDASALLGEFLRGRGHVVQIAHDGPGALRVVERFRPDLAVLDLGLPVMDGVELAGQLRARLGAMLPLIALTGYGQDAARARTREAGFAHHVVKPSTPIELARLIESTAR